MNNTKKSLLIPSINQSTLLKRLRDLISIPSVNPSLVPGESGEEKISLYLYQSLKKLGLQTFKQKVSPNRSNIVGIL